MRLCFIYPCEKEKSEAKEKGQKSCCTQTILSSYNSCALLRQLPSLPRRLQRSTLGLWTLNCCVRNGNRWYRPGIITALLTCPRAKPAGRMRLGNKSYGKVSQESSPKDADDWLTLTALSVCPLKTSQKKLQANCSC